MLGAERWAQRELSQGRWDRAGGCAGRGQVQGEVGGRERLRSSSSAAWRDLLILLTYAVFALRYPEQLRAGCRCTFRLQNVHPSPFSLGKTCPEAQANQGPRENSQQCRQLPRALCPSVPTAASVKTSGTSRETEASGSKGVCSGHLRSWGDSQLQNPSLCPRNGFILI